MMRSWSFSMKRLADPDINDAGRPRFCPRERGPSLSRQAVKGVATNSFAFRLYALGVIGIALLVGCERSRPSFRASAHRVAPASLPAPVATTASFDGSIIFASNILRASWGHRVAMVEARITNVGVLASRLNDWSVSGTILGGQGTIRGRIMAPSRHELCRHHQ